MSENKRYSLFDPDGPETLTRVRVSVWLDGAVNVMCDTDDVDICGAPVEILIDERLAPGVIDILLKRALNSRALWSYSHAPDDEPF